MIPIGLALLWAPILVMLHEAGHAFAALALTDGDVSLKIEGVGVFGGTVTYDAGSLTRPRDAAWIAAAGPAVTLAAAVVLWSVWLKAPDSFATITGGGAWLATLQFVTTALPLRYGKGLGGPADSDGRVIWRVLTGAPPGGLARELARESKPDRAVRPMFVVLLAVVGVLTLIVDPPMVLALAIVFGVAVVFQRNARGS